MDTLKAIENKFSCLSAQCNYNSYVKTKWPFKVKQKRSKVERVQILHQFSWDDSVFNNEVKSSELLEN